MKKSLRTYTELSKLYTFEDRLEYLKLHGVVASETFGAERFLNQMLYRSSKWKRVRDLVIIRDNGCNLGIDGHTIFSGLIVHHMNPITIDQIESGDKSIFDPEFLICTDLQTHNVIHYGDVDSSLLSLSERKPGDTKLW